MMRPWLYVKMIYILFSCSPANEIDDTHILTISPNIDQSNDFNQRIIANLTDFLVSKNSSLTENTYWDTLDFKKYVYPYLDIHQMENSNQGANFFKPTLMEIAHTEDPDLKLLKIAFIGYNQKTKENQLKSIYNILAHKQDEKMVFKRCTEWLTHNWQTLNEESIIYKIPTCKNANKEEISRQLKEIQSICRFFETQPIPITYYSCSSPKEIFEIKGFDYHPLMYVSSSGGLADYGNIVYSGNDSEYYTHEIVHIYTMNLFPRINKFVDEGMATFFGGSGKFSYLWHRAQMKKFIAKDTDYNFAEHTDPFERLYFEEETPLPYMAAALIVERTLRMYGKEKLFELMQSSEGLWDILNLVGLNRENFHEELMNEIQRPPLDRTTYLN
jgi:hypothetical protein